MISVSDKFIFCEFTTVLQITYFDGTHVFLLGSPTVSAQLSINPLYDVPGALRRRNYVEGRRHGATLLEVAYPKLATRELPLDVGSLLEVFKFTL